MDIIKIGLGLLLLLTISCNSDDGIDLRKDKVLVKEVMIFNSINPESASFKETLSFSYNKQAFVNTINTDLEYIDLYSYDPETDRFPNKTIKSKTNSSFLYNDKNLIEKEIKVIDGKRLVKKFTYNQEDQLIAIEEEHKTTTFYYNNFNLVGQIDMVYHSIDFPNSHHIIQYHEDGNIKEVYYTNLNESFYSEFDLFDIKTPFAASNINLSLKLFNNQYKFYNRVKFPDFLDNFEFVYKGNKLLKTMTTSPYIPGPKNIIQRHEILKTIEDQPLRTLINGSTEVIYTY